MGGKGKGPSNAKKDARDFNTRMREYARRRRKLPKSPDTPGADTPASPPVPVQRQAAKYMLLEVPNFNNAEEESEAMNSYLRLGTVPEPAIAGMFDAPKATGEDLAAHATFFLGDDRKTEGSPGYVPPEKRQAETDILHTKGGWRDHSDGNRISTTRGDKVEVIRGNYKLVVLNRQDEPIGGAGWDISGGHMEGLGLSSAIEWVQTFDGTWRVVETSEKGDTITTQHGNNVSYSYGDIQDSTTGSEDELRPATDEDGNPIQVPAPNPVITNRTWASRIESYTGSPGHRVPSISDRTWVDKMSTETHAGEMTDETHVDGLMTTTTTALLLTDTTIGNVASINIGTVTDLTVGNMLSMTVGAQEEITIGAMLELTLAERIELNITNALEVSLGHRTELDLSSKTDLSPEKQEVAGSVKRVAGVESVTAGVYKLSAGLILLG